MSLNELHDLELGTVENETIPMIMSFFSYMC